MKTTDDAAGSNAKAKVGVVAEKTTTNLADTQADHDQELAQILPFADEVEGGFKEQTAHTQPHVRTGGRLPLASP